MQSPIPLPTKKSSVRSRAAFRGSENYRGRACKVCGTKIRRVSDQKCVKCYENGVTYYTRNREKAKAYYLKKYHGDQTNRAEIMWKRARYRAEKNGLEFNLDLEDIVIPKICPVFGTHLTKPSLDRVDNSKGYIKGNVRVISNRANTLKGNMTLSEVKRLLNYMESSLN